METLKLIAYNSFHGRQVNVFAKGEKQFYLTRRQYKRYWNKVCGVSGCKCSTRIYDYAGNSYTAISENGIANPDTYLLLKHISF
jgi:hypothetical protein